VTFDPSRIRWDPAKAAANARKHGVTFDEAKDALFDPWAVTWFDEDHSSAREERYRTVCLSPRARILLVVTAEKDEDVVRIVSARPATARERRTYEEGR
jgi:uncharacterized DUF497 family protein